ncbi:MAG TPA: GNAT family N-acetyltransferase [Solirubrobacteraceae bacterium]|nr:GNAT family N-acetyltransferase [Solirubrobacteraceae bacterium]
MIRPARADEVAALVAAYEWLFAPPGSRPPMWDPDAAARRLRALIAADDGEVLVADDDGAIVGICTVALDIESVRFGQRAWVEDLAVHADHRSAGHGKALLDAAKDWGRARGASHLELDSGEARADAHRFYDREQPTWRSVCFGWEL